MGGPYIRVPFPLYLVCSVCAVEQEHQFPSAFSLSLSLRLCRGDHSLSLLLIVLHSISHLLIRSLSSAATLTWYQSAWLFEGRRRAAFSAIEGCVLSEELVAEIEAEFAFSWCGGI